MHYSDLSFYVLSRSSILCLFKSYAIRTFLVVQWLRFHASNAEGSGLIPGQGTKMLHATWPIREREVTQLCPTLCDPMDCSLPGSSVHGIFQAIVLKWIAISFSRASFPTQGSNPGLPHYRQTLYHLSHQAIY